MEIFHSREAFTIENDTALYSSKVNAYRDIAAETYLP